MLFLALAVLSCAGHCQEKTEGPLVVGVSYVSTQSVYLSGGKNRSLAPGDTGTVYHRRAVTGRVVITAVSTGSSSARLLSPGDSAVVGDSVMFSSLIFESRLAAARSRTLQESGVNPKRERSSSSLLHGRVALQYSGSGEWAGGATLSRPSLLLHLDAGPIPGTALRFSVHGRVDGALPTPGRTGETRGTTLRLYDLTLAQDDARMWYGFGVGRISSAHVGGLGLIDGAQVFLRTGSFTVGVLGGFQPDYRTSGFDSQTQKLAGFLNYAWGEGPTLRGGTTLAYGQQMLRGVLDRNFLYLQNSTAFSTVLFLYQSTEVDLHRRDGEGHKADFRLTNTFFTLSYQPLHWLSANLGYDASRRIEFLESEKSIADSLLDRDLRQGFRGSVYFRLPMNIALSALGGYRLAAGGQPAGYSAGSGLRISDLAGSGVSVGGQYLRVKSPYTDGNDITGECEFAPTGSVLLSLKWNQYAFIPLGLDTGEGRIVISTVTGSASWNVSRGWYVTIFGDRVRESERLLYRVFAEAGYHF